MRDSHSGRRDGVSRRQFLSTTLVGTGAAALASAGARTRAAAEIPGGASARVIWVESEHVIRSTGVHEGVLEDLLVMVLTTLTAEATAVQAWQSMLKPGERIALKFNHRAATELATTDALLRALVKSLGAAGFGPDRIVAVEVSPAVRKELGVQAPRQGWTDDAYDFGSGSDRLAVWLEDVDAIINVPFLKDHNIAGLSCCLKNLSHAVVKHPAQFHSNGCSPFIGDIVALAPIADKIRLHLVNALRVVYQGGPGADAGYIHNRGLLLAARDSVAAELVALQELNEIRKSKGMPLLTEDGGLPRYLASACRRGVGVSRLHQVQLEKKQL